MADRRNRLVLGVVGLLLLLGGGLAACYGAGLFGTARSDQAVFDTTVVRWWNEGGWMSFAVVVAIGAVGAVTGVLLMLAQLRRNDGRSRTPTFAYPSRPGDQGETSLRAAALSHGLETDMESLPDVHHAAVGLFGRYPDLELRAVIDVGDNADLDQLPDRIQQTLDRLAVTAGLRPDPVQVTVRFKSADPERQLA
jgi:hypothetical protein